MSLNVIFMGTPDFAVPTLRQIVSQGHNVAAVYSQPPRPAGRGMAERKSPVHVFADQAELDVLTPKSLKSADEQSRFRNFECDVAVIVAYGLILPRPILDYPRLGCYNLHASLLPRWRGAAPIQRAIMAGDEDSGAMVMRMEAGLDTGPVCMTERVKIAPEMTAGDLHDDLAASGALLMARALSRMERGDLDCEPQNESDVTYAKKIEKSEARIDWQHPARDIHNQIRGLSPFPGAWFELERDGKLHRVKILKSSLVQPSGNSGKPGAVLDDELTIACGEGCIQLLSLQRAGKKAMVATDFLRGWSLTSGDGLA